METLQTLGGVKSCTVPYVFGIAQPIYWSLEDEDVAII
jgi:hypothetical protein